jgi:hypothetical protein
MALLQQRVGAAAGRGRAGEPAGEPEQAGVRVGGPAVRRALEGGDGVGGRPSRSPPAIRQLGVVERAAEGLGRVDSDVLARASLAARGRSRWAAASSAWRTWEGIGGDVAGQQAVEAFELVGEACRGVREMVRSQAADAGRRPAVAVLVGEAQETLAGLSGVR